MAKSYWPFDAGAGSSATEARYSQMARHWLTDGVVRSELNSLEVYADSTGMQVKVKSGTGVAKGHWLRSDAEDAYAIAAAHGSNPRIDRVVLSVDWSNNIVDVKVVTGTAAATPSAPALVQNDLTEWQIPLATVTVPAAASTITAANVADARQYAIPELRGMPTARVYRNSVQSIGSGAFTSISFTHARVNPYRMWASGAPTRLTVPVSGIWVASGSVAFAGAGSAYRAIARIRLNGTTDIAGDTRSPASGHEAGFALSSPPYQLTAGDYLELVVQQNSGANLNVDTFSAYTPEFGAHLVATS